MTAVYTVDLNLKNKTMAKKIKKYQGKTGSSSVTPTKDSTDYFYNKSTQDIRNATNIIQKKGSSSKEYSKAFDIQMKSLADLRRQANKGKPGYDANGYPVNKRTGGPVTALDQVDRIEKAKFGKSKK
jgi:hypothetical protein